MIHDGLLDILSVILDESILALQADAMNWTQFEACVFAFYSIAEQVYSHEHKNIPKLMRVLNEIPYEKMNEKLLGTALETLGELGFFQVFSDCILIHVLLSSRRWLL